VKTLLACLGPLAMLVSGMETTALRADASDPQAPVTDVHKAPEFKVLFVGNGNTVSLRMDYGRIAKVRLRGVSASQESAPFLKKLLEDQSVTAEFEPADPGKTGDRSAYLYRATDGLFINLEMIRQGYGKVSEASFPDKDRFEAQEREARAGQRGLWNPDAPKVSPPPTDPVNRPSVRPAYRSSRRPNIASMLGNSFQSFQPAATPPPAWSTAAQFIPPSPVAPVDSWPQPQPIYPPEPWPPPAPPPCPPGPQPPPAPPPCPPGPPVFQPIVPVPPQPLTPRPSPPAPPPPVSSPVPRALPQLGSQPTLSLSGNSGGPDPRNDRRR
jgi:endonuclease YncB( thermonuclease family)